jgi:hypothetical protein
MPETREIELAVEAAMIRRALSGKPWTFDEMSQIERGTPGAENWWGRHADRTHQRWRRKGWATFTRTGRAPRWTLTASGQAALGGANG